LIFKIYPELLFSNSDIYSAPYFISFPHSAYLNNKFLSLSCTNSTEAAELLSCSKLCCSVELNAPLASLLMILKWKVLLTLWRDERPCRRIPIDWSTGL